MAKEYKIHAGYILLILLAIIVVLATKNFSDIPKLVEMIMFALSVTSLILALLAIAYTIYSNSFITQNIGTLSTASNRISQVAEDLQNAVTPIPGALQSVETQMLETRTLLKAGLEKLPVGPSGEVQKGTGVEIRDEFFKIASFGALYILYACVLAKERGVSIDLERLGTYSKLPNISLYWQGFVAALEALGVISLTEPSTSNITISALHPKISASASGALDAAHNRPEAKVINEVINKQRLEQYFQ